MQLDSAITEWRRVIPWQPNQHRLFEAAASSPQVAARVGIPQAKAAQMASEGIKRKSLAQALRKANPKEA